MKNSKCYQKVVPKAAHSDVSYLFIEKCSPVISSTWIQFKLEESWNLEGYCNNSHKDDVKVDWMSWGQGLANCFVALD